MECIPRDGNVDLSSDSVNPLTTIDLDCDWNTASFILIKSPGFEPLKGARTRANLAWLLPSLLSSSRLREQVSTIRNEEDDEVFEMVQTYGIAQESPAEPGTSVGGEQSALLGGDRDTTVKRVGMPDGNATIVSCIGNLSNTIIGSGEYILTISRILN